MGEVKEEVPVDEGAAGEGEGVQGEKMVPVSESIRYRKRAQAAEQKLSELGERVAALNEELGEAKAELAVVERRQRVDRLLVESEAIDLEAARLLTEAAVAQMGEADVEQVVAELKRRKPYLFRRGGYGGGAMAGKARTGAESIRDEAAAEAAGSGDRRDLLRYLRLRREK